MSFPLASLLPSLPFSALLYPTLLFLTAVSHYLHGAPFSFLACRSSTVQLFLFIFLRVPFPCPFSMKTFLTTPRRTELFSPLPYTKISVLEPTALYSTSLFEIYPLSLRYKFLKGTGPCLLDLPSRHFTGLDECLLNT